MENKTLAIEAVQTNSETKNEPRLKWTKPQLSPLGVADGTIGKPPFPTSEYVTNINNVTVGGS
jgi:hypothetical protein